MNEQIKSELDVFSKEAELSDAKSIKGLRAVFGEVSIHDLARLNSVQTFKLVSYFCPGWVVGVS